LTQLEQFIVGFVDLPPTLVYVVIGALAALENIIPIVPADAAVAFGAFLSGTGRISAWSVFAFTWIGNVSSAVMTYLVARHLGRPFFRSRLGERLLKPAALHRLEILYGKYGTWGIFFSRFVPALRAVVPQFAGVANVGAVKTIVPMALASAIWYGTITYVAATVVREFDEIKTLVFQLNRAGAIVVGTVVVAGVAWWLLRRRRVTKDHDDE